MHNFRYLWQRWWPNNAARCIFFLPLIAAAFWKLWVAIHEPNQLEMMVAVDHLTKMQVEYATKSEPTGEYTATYLLRAGGLRKVHLPVKPNTLFSLRLHPGQGPIVMQLASMRIRTGSLGWLRHRTLYDFDLGELKPLRHVDELAREGQTVQITIGDEADSCLGITPLKPLRLGIDWIAPSCQFLLYALCWVTIWLIGVEIGRWNAFWRVIEKWKLVQGSPIAKAPLQKGDELWQGTVIPLACVALVLFLREPGFFVRPQFWAEDAKVLFYEAREYGWHSLWMPHPAYYILAQRLVACLTANLSALVAPWIYCYAALAYTLLSAWFCLRARLDCLMDRPGRIALALALVLIPQGGETQMKLIGCQWVLMSILLILIVQDQPHRPGQAIVDMAGLFLAGLTGPYIILYAPWFLVRLRKAAGGWSRYNVSLIAAAWSVALLQIVSIWMMPSDSVALNHDPTAWITELMVILPGSLFFGDMAPRYLGWTIYVLSPLALLLLVWAVVCGDKKRRWTVLALCGCGVLAYAAGIRAVAPNPVIGPFGAGDRYFTPIYTVAMWLGVIYFYDASKRLRIASAIALGMMLMSSASHFKGDEWPDLRWGDYVERLDAGEAVQFSALPGWEIEIPARK